MWLIAALSLISNSLVVLSAFFSPASSVTPAKLLIGLLALVNGLMGVWSGWLAAVDAWTYGSFWRYRTRLYRWILENVVCGDSGWRNATDNQLTTDDASPFVFLLIPFDPILEILFILTNQNSSRCRYGASWESSFLCPLSGFLCVFASQTGLFLLATAALERYLATTVWRHTSDGHNGARKRHKHTNAVVKVSPV